MMKRWAGLRAVLLGLGGKRTFAQKAEITLPQGAQLGLGDDVKYSPDETHLAVSTLIEIELPDVRTLYLGQFLLTLEMLMLASIPTTRRQGK